MRIGTAVAALSLVGFSGAQGVGSFHRRFTVSGPTQLTVQADAGAIRVTGAPGSAVVVDATIRQDWSWWGGGDSGAIQEIENHPPVEQSGNHIWLRQASGFRFRHITIAYVITAPPDTTLNARADSGEITVAGMREADLKTDSGGIRVGALDGDLRAASDSGDIHFDRVGGDARLSTDSGGIEGNQVAGHLYASSDSGDIEIQAAGRGAEAKTDSGSVTLEGVAGDLDAHSSSGELRVDGTLAAEHHWRLRDDDGSVRVGLPAGTVAQVQIQSDDGRVVVELPGRGNSGEGHHSWRGQLGGGAGRAATARLTITTDSGSVTVN